MLDRISLRDIPTVTLVLVATSILTYLARELGLDTRIFYISEYYNRGLFEVMNGKIWRLVTPIFLHFSILHIVFNMLVMLVFAGAIEKKYGKIYFIIMVLVFAVTSNIGQLIYSGPYFGGMSGVAYGVFGYLWMQSKFNPWSGLLIHDQEIIFILIWFVAAWFGVLGNIANMAHTVGLLAGMVWGYSHAMLVNHQRRR